MNAVKDHTSPTHRPARATPAFSRFPGEGTGGGDDPRARTWCGDVEFFFLHSVRSRECGQGAGNKCSEMGLGDATATVCSCQDDLCNYATPFHASPFVASVVLLTAGLLAQTLVHAERGRRPENVVWRIKGSLTNPLS